MTQKTVKDYYAILGVTSQASLEEIRLAYRRMARVYHPDLSIDPDAEAHFKEVNEAYDILANAEKRRAYDYFTAGTVEDEPVEPPSMPQQPPASPKTTPEPARRDVFTGEPRRESQPSAPETSSGRRRVYPPTWAILLIIIGGCVIVSVGVGAALSLRGNRATGGAESVGVTKLTTFTSPPEIPADRTVILEDNTPLRTIAPTALDVSGTRYPVAAVLPEQGRWPLPAEQEDLGLWIYGTLINYVIGLPYTADTESLLSGLTSGDRITLTLENGTALAFGSPQMKRVDAADLSPMAQDIPELTLLILGNDRPNRLVVQARYLPEDTLPAGEQSADGLIVQIESADILPDTTGNSDSWYFVVEYQVTNTTGSPVDPSFFDMVLEDGAGQRYVLNEEATELGQHGQLSVSLAPNATAQGSAGYVIPRTVTVPLVWIFRADPTSRDSARLVTSFKPPTPGPAVPDVELTDVFLDQGRNVIVVSGTVYNDGESDLGVTADLVDLTSSDGTSSLAAASPLLPWAVAVGGYQDFELQFSTPEQATSVLLNILGFTFQIDGLTP